MRAVGAAQQAGVEGEEGEFDQGRGQAEVDLVGEEQFQGAGRGGEGDVVGVAMAVEQCVDYYDGDIEGQGWNLWG